MWGVLFAYVRWIMTVADFLNALSTKATVSIIQDKVVILEVKNVGNVADKLSSDLAGATVEEIEVIGSSSVSVTIASAL